MKSDFINRAQSVASWARFLSKDEKRYVSFSVKMLPADARHILYLRYWRDFEFNEIGKALRMKPNEVLFGHNKALQILKAIFENAAVINMAI